jgi:beta-glucanase (GH16 family)
MIEAPVAATQTETHTYALNWTAEAITWIIDSKPVRTLKFGDANGGKTFPQTPCNVRIGNWAGGDSKDKGTVEWAGGVPDYTKGPFTMTIDSVKVINYSPGTEYKWTDKTGSHDSIEVIGAGNKDGAPQNSAVIGASATVPTAPLASGINTPTNGTIGEGKPGSPADSTITGSPVSGGKSGFAYPTGGAGGNKEGADGKPCDCGTATVTVTGAPPASFTTKYPALPPNSVISSVKVPSISSAAAVKPPPFSSSGLLIETMPPPSVPRPSVPSVPRPSAPSAGLPTPSRNATTTAPAQFTGAASHNKAGVFVGALAGVVLLAF